jgi:hypothetical protein
MMKQALDDWDILVLVVEQYYRHADVLPCALLALKVDPTMGPLGLCEGVVLSKGRTSLGPPVGTNLSP